MHSAALDWLTSANLADHDVAGDLPDWPAFVDALGKAEGKSWVWHGANCLGPEYRRCLVSLSPGGTDADVVREFDVPSGHGEKAWEFTMPVTVLGCRCSTASGSGARTGESTPARSSASRTRC